ncbi:MAG: NAD(P)H-dependent oxidoreductase [Candidatus Omnitrophota bacterium]
MKILLLDGSCEGDNILKNAHSFIKQHFENKNCDIKSFILRDINILHCLGCYKCWTKTPGICFQKDVGMEIVYAAAQSDFWVFLTPVTYGGYSQHLKKALDRISLPLLLPSFIAIDGETHYNVRYKNKIGLVVFGSTNIKDQEQESIFANLVCRNSINLSNKPASSKILFDNYKEDSIIKILTDVLEESGV